jgi:hypothetical protein
MKKWFILHILCIVSFWISIFYIIHRTGPPVRSYLMIHCPVLYDVKVKIAIVIVLFTWPAFGSLKSLYRGNQGGE